MGKNERKQGWLGHLLVILTSMVLLTSWSLCGTYAKYVSEGSASSTARVARFEVTEEGKLIQDAVIDIAIAPGETESREISVTNLSEVAIAYKITAYNQTGNLPLEFYMSDSPGNKTSEDGNTDSQIQNEEAGTTNTIKEIEQGELPAETTNPQPKLYYLIITWPKEKNNPEYAGMTDLFTVRLEATQID